MVVRCSLDLLLLPCQSGSGQRRTSLAHCSPSHKPQTCLRQLSILDKLNPKWAGFPGQEKHMEPIWEPGALS